MKIEINIDDKLITRVKDLFTKRNIITFLTMCFVMSIVITKAADFGLHVFEPDTVISSTEVNENFANLFKQINANTPAGTVVAYAGSVIPEGWLECNGAAVSRTEYSELFTALGTSWGVGDGDSTFNLPDLRGRFLRGVDGDAGNDSDNAARTALNGGSAGNVVGSYQEDAIRNITGKFDGNVDDSATFKSGAFYQTSAYYGLGANGNGDTYSGYIYFDASKVVPTGSDNRPKNAYVFYIIKAD
ncbi:MAG TPA: phage tail protein [Spirochaetota bacterium]|nr:phage tail protein [Spirochaetota bacterium]